MKGEEKVVHLRLSEGTRSLREVLALVRELQGQHPEREVFFDGDEQAICSRLRGGVAPKD